MLEAIGDVGQTTVVLSGAVLRFTDGLGEVGVASLVLGVDGNIIIPCRAVNGGHGQRYKEGVAGAGDHFGNASLHNEVQALVHVGRRGMTGRIGLSHGNAAVLHGNFQSVLESGRIGSQCGGQLVVQSIAGVVVDTTLSLVGICVGQADGGQHGVGALRVVEAIQYAHLALAVHHFVVHGDISYLQIRELNALNGVFAQLVNDGIVMQAGGNVGFRIPHAIFAGFGNVIFIDTQGCFLRRINGRLGKCRSNEAQGHNGGHEHGEYAMDLFHLVFSFVM